MKTQLRFIFTFALLITLGVQAQNLNSLYGEYTFDNGSLSNTFDPSFGTLTKTGTSSVLLTDRNNVANNAIALNTDTLDGTVNNNMTSVINYSMSLWFNTTTNNTDRTLWRNYDNFGNEVNIKMTSAGKIVSDVHIGFGATYTEEIDTPNFILDGNWHHIVITLQKYIVSGSGRLRVRMYIDGIEEPDLYMDGINYGAIWQAGHLVEVTDYNDGLDEVQHYSNTLTDVDVATLYSQNICTPTQFTSLSNSNLSIEVGWDADASVSEWDLAYVVSGQNFNGNANISGLNSKNISVTGLQPDTRYNFFVRGVCGGVPSVWRRGIFNTEKNPIYLDPGATGANDGSSWADAYTNLSTALSNELERTFWLKSGTYTPNNTGRSSRFLITENQKLYGGFSGTETQLSQRNIANNPTVLSGDFNGDDDNTILSYSNATKSENAYRIAIVGGVSVVLDGLIFSGGHANGNTNSLREGSGLLMETTTRVTNCIFENNINTRGGALSIASGPNGQTVRLENNIFRKNLAGFAAAFYSPTGRAGTFELVNNLFHDNETKPSSAGNGLSGVIWFRSANNNFSDNFTFINNTFANNTYDVQDVNCNVRTNHVGNIITKFYNNVFWNNTDNTFRAFHIGGGSFFQIDIKNNLDENNFSNLSNNFVTSIANTITANPEFIDATNNDYRLMSTSPAIDVGDNSYLPSDVSDDLSNNIRIFNTTVDLGAFEFNSTLSIDEITFEKTDVNIYPNPTSAVLNILSSNAQIEQVEIYDMLGKQVLKTNRTEINVSNLKTGIYLLKAKTILGEVVKRFIKQ